MSSGSAIRKHDHPSFFKILLDASAAKLPLPPAFSKKYFLDGKFPENSILKTKAGEKWNLKITEIDGRYCFVDGWVGFVKDNKLDSGDFLVFWMMDESTFLVALYDPSCCEKESSSTNSSSTPSCGSKCSQSKSGNGEGKIPLNPVKVEVMDEEEVVEAAKRPAEVVKKAVIVKEDGIDSDGWEKPENPNFRIVLSKVHKRSMVVPKQFVSETGLGSKRGMVLRDVKGRKCAVRLALQSDGDVSIGSGWSRFRKENKLKEGDTCSFQFLESEGNLIHVQVRKEEKRRRGRPRNLEKRGRPPTVYF